MAGVSKSVTCAQSDSISKVESVSPCCVRLERISRYVESSGGQSKQDEASNEPAETESDSGDSLFITQKPELEVSEDDASLSAFHGEESKTNKRRTTVYKKKCRLPKYNFAFLSGRKWKPRSTELSVQQNTSLHYYALKGFFKRVQELWEGYDVESLDEDGDCSPLSEGEEGKSEDEDIKVVERKHFLAPSKAKRRQTWCNQFQQEERRNACNAQQETSQTGRWKTLHKIPAVASVSRVTPLSLDTESTDDGESSCRVLAEQERHDESITSDGSLAQKETPETNRHLTQDNEISFQHKAKEGDDDSDATVCEPPNPQRSSRQYAEDDREASTNTTEPQTDVLHIDTLSQTGQRVDEPESLILFHSLPDLISDNNNDSVHNETREKNEKDSDHESREEEKGQSEEEPENLQAAKSVNVVVEETPSLSEDTRAEPPAWQNSDELDFNERNCMVNSLCDDTILRQEERDIPDLKQKKKKEKKSRAEDAGEEVDGNIEPDVRMEESVFSVSCNMENGSKKKKKKKRKRSDEDVEQLQSSASAEPLNDDAEVQKKKKKRKKEKKIVVAEECEEEKAQNRTLDLPQISEQLEESGNGSENTAATEETFESTHVKRKKHKKKRQTPSTVDTQNGQEGVDVNFSNDAVTLEESTGRKKKKKKKKTISEGVDISYNEEYEKVEDIDNTQKTKEGIEDLNAELVIKKKKKKTRGESSRNKISDDNVTQSDDSVSVWGKEKKRTSSFLFADAEENDAQTHREQNPPSQHVDAHVWGAENPAVSGGDFETKSAEMTGNWEESKDGVRKKKKKRKMPVELDSVDKDHERDLEEPNEICQSALPESTHTVKRKKKRMGNESELVTPVEGLESVADAGPTDEAVVSKKKKKKKKKYKDEPCHVIQESPQTAIEDTESKSVLNTCSSHKKTVSHKKKGKHEYSSEKSHDSRTSDQATQETLTTVKQASLSPETPGNQTGNDTRVKKKKKKIKSTDHIQPEGKLLTVSTESEPQETKKKKKKERNKQPADLNTISSSPMLSFSNRIMTHSIKRRLHNPSEDFLTDF